MRDPPAYPFMRDAAGDGVVYESRGRPHVASKPVGPTGGRDRLSAVPATAPCSGAITRAVSAEDCAYQRRMDRDKRRLGLRTVT